MKMDTPVKLIKAKYDGIGAKNAQADAFAKDEAEDEDNTMASLQEAQKEQDVETAKVEAKKKAAVDKAVQQMLEEEKKKNANSNKELDEAKSMEKEMLAMRDNTFAAIQTQN